MENINYEIHEYAGLVPMASEEEQTSLTNDIRLNGLREPIVLWKGEIVDGRCRQIACKINGERIRTKELDDSLTDEEVKIFVKSINTRRNLTSTQKVMSACRQSLDPSVKLTIKEIAKSWGITETLLKNAKYIAKNRPEFIDPLFNGKSVVIVNSKGLEITSNKVTAIYAFVKRENESVSENNDHAWHENTYIKTQKGKEWYYDAINKNKIKDIPTRMMIAELANYKFKG